MHRLSIVLSVVGLSLLITVILISGLPLHVSAQSGSQSPREISVSGAGSVTVTPDMASVNIGVETDNPDLTTSTNEANTKVGAITKTIKDLGVAAQDIQTASYEISQYTDDNERTHFRTRNVLRVTIHKIDDLKKVINSSMDAGANIVEEIEFSVSDTRQADRT